MRTNFFAVLGVVLSSLLLSAPASRAAEPQAQQTTQTGVYKMAIDRSVSLDEAAESMRLRANALNLKLVAELPLSKQVEAVVGSPQPVITIFQFCDAVTAKDLIDVDVELAIYMPCRIALVEDKKGQGQIVMMDIDIEMLAKQKKLSPELKARIAEVRKSLEAIMRAGANGDL